MSTASPTRVLVVENDPFWQTILTTLLRDLGYAVLGPAATAAEALALAHSGAPAAALLDLDQHHEPDGLTLAGLLQQPRPLPWLLLRGTTAPPPTPEVQAASAVARVRKTFDRQALNEQLELALQLALRPAPEPYDRSRYLADYVFVRIQGSLTRLMLHDILYLEADGNYIRVVLTHGQQTLRCSLKELARLLAADGFIQCQRSYLLNLRHVTGLGANQTEVLLGKVTLPLSRSFHDLLLACLRRVE